MTALPPAENPDEPLMTLTWEAYRSCGGAGWVGSRADHEHPGCGHRCILCDPPPGYDRTYAITAKEQIHG